MDPEQRKHGREKFEEVMGFTAPDIEEPFLDTVPTGPS